MNKEIQTLIAMQLILQKDSITTHDYTSNNKIIENKSLSILEALKVAINEGLDIMLPLDEEQTNLSNSNYYSMGTNGKITFIEKMIDSHGDKEITNFLYEKLTEEDLKKAHPKFMKNMYSALSENGISMKKMFELGFDFKQETFDEESKASAGDLDFFECCLCYKPDFDFEHKYSAEFTLKDCIEEEIKYNKQNNRSIAKEESLLNFIDKAIIKQKLERKPIEQNVKENKLKI